MNFVHGIITLKCILSANSESNSIRVETERQFFDPRIASGNAYLVNNIPKTKLSYLVLAVFGAKAVGHEIDSRSY